MANAPKTCVIEGLPSAGKTITINALKEERGWGKIPEIAETLGNERFPGNGKNADEIAAIDSWFIQKEAARTSAGFDFNGRYVLFDRNFLTHLTYAFAYSKLKGLDSFKMTVNNYIKAIQNGLLTGSDCYFYFKICPETMIRRTQAREYESSHIRLPKFWFDKNYLSWLVIAYDILFKHLNESARVFVIDAEKSPEEVRQETRDRILGLVTERQSDEQLIAAIRGYYEELKDD